MTTHDDARHRRHPTPFRKDTTAMFHIEYPGFAAEERQARFRAEAERERSGGFRRRPFRRRAGESIIRFGRRIGGEAMSDPLADAHSTPAWLG